MTQSVFVTGATGYLGGKIARLLAAEGFQIRALTRQGSDRSALSAIDVEWIEGDLLDASSYAASLAGCEFVIHSAGLVKNWERDPSRFDRINVDATDQLLAAALDNQVRRVVYTSSFFTLGPSDGPKAHDESASRPGFYCNDYDRTKIRASELVKRYRERGLDIVACLPTVIYGPGARTQGNHVATILSDLLAAKLPGLIGDGAQVWNYAHVDDVARGHILALQKGERNASYLLGGENISLAEFVWLACDLGGVKKLTRRVPFWVLDALAGVQMMRAKLFGVAPELTPGMVAAYRQHWACDDSRARVELGYGARPLREGLATTLAWLKEQA